MKQHRFLDRIRALETVVRSGAVSRIMPTWIEADGPNVPIGTLCVVGQGAAHVMAEVVKAANDGIALVPFGDTSKLAIGAPVIAQTDGAVLPVGDPFLGRAIDALGNPIDRGAPIYPSHLASLHAELPQPLERTSPKAIFETGVRAIDGLLTLGIGQRFGVFAASGVGKTSLMSQIARQAEADCAVICLVGERGREVEHLWTHELPEAVRARTTLVAATSDKAAALRVRAVHQALAIARDWRAQGRHVLFILDSVTRLAMAMRETGLAAGEPPTVRAYTPGVFAALPRIVEQCGALKSGGAITALMTILSETDENDDPVAELMKSLLDGHILLSRPLAERGHFPAIDVPRSISRNAAALMSLEHREKSRAVLAHLATYEASKTLIESGLYTAGASEAIDAAIAAKPEIDRFLKQEQDERFGLSATLHGLKRVSEVRHEPIAAAA